MTNEIRIGSTVDTKKLTKNQVAALKALLAAGAPVTLPRWDKKSPTIAGVKVTYIEYVLQGGEVGKQLIFNCTNWDRFNSPGVFALVDGKQRLEAARKFLRDEVKVFGDNVCSEMGKLPFIDYTFRVRIMKLDTRAKMLRLYLSLNAGGTPHDPKEIERVRALLAEEEK